MKSENDDLEWDYCEREHENALIAQLIDELNKVKPDCGFIKLIIFDWFSFYLCRSVGAEESYCSRSC